MSEFMKRPYRDKRVREKRLALAEEYHSKIAKRSRKVKNVGLIFVSPELIEIAEAASAGVQSSDTEDINTGAATSE